MGVEGDTPYLIRRWPVFMNWSSGTCDETSRSWRRRRSSLFVDEGRDRRGDDSGRPCSERCRLVLQESSTRL